MVCSETQKKCYIYRGRGADWPINEGREGKSDLLGCALPMQFINLLPIL